jgi:hypothetical protein
MSYGINVDLAASASSSAQQRGEVTTTTFGPNAGITFAPESAAGPNYWPWIIGGVMLLLVLLLMRR